MHAISIPGRDGLGSAKAALSEAHCQGLMATSGRLFAVANWALT